MQERKQPESTRLRNPSVSFTVGDVAASFAFYRDVLGFTERERYEENGQLSGVEMVAGSVRVFLAQDDFARGRERQKGVGFRVWFETDQVDELAAGVVARGGVLAEPLQDRPWGSRDFGMVDPDGFKLSFTTALT
jgi:uncharacterized glyoxalase superfamily protein PhnB